MENKIIDIELVDEMSRSYMDYSMSVIVSRALPDVRDGLKPVHRRILYSMAKQGMLPERGYKKSARIVGDTMAKYHPHGDSSIYEAMVRMTQDFSMRYVLVDGHGNFGSIDGDSAAAQRYTEAKLDKLAIWMLKDIDKNTVDFKTTYDEESEEPTVLPARFPNLLVNGSSGIAVGMATNIPPHNLKEIAGAVFKIIDNYVEEERETKVEELLEIVQGPDFPTYGKILGKRGIRDAYTTGKGKIKLRGVAEIESMGSGKDMIVITELPYQVNKKKLVEKIAELVKDKKIEGITDLRDESDLEKGIRVVVELRRGVNGNIVLNQLYKYTQLEDSYGINLLTLVNNEPKTLNLLEMLECYIEHQKEVITRRTEYSLEKAKRRLHILEGLFKALDNIDEVIKVIRGSKDSSEAKGKLEEQFGLTEVQASSIVEMRLKTLTGLERGKLEEEYKGIKELVEKLESILRDGKVLYKTIREELEEVVSIFGDERRTRLEEDVEILEEEALIENETVVVTLTDMDYIKRTPLSVYKAQNRGGKGVVGVSMRSEDIVKSVDICEVHDTILFFTTKGKVYSVKGYQIPEASRKAKGTSIKNVLQLEEGERVKRVIPVKSLTECSEEASFVMLTKQGLVKKTYIKEYMNIRKVGLIAINLREGDELVDVGVTDGRDTILIGTRLGKCIRFEEGQLRNLGRNTSGVKSMNIKEGDSVLGFVVGKGEEKVLTVAENGYGKLTSLSEFKSQTRGGIGVYLSKVTKKTGELVGLLTVKSEDEIILLNDIGSIIRIKVSEIRDTGRVAQGVKLIDLGVNESVIGITRVPKEV